MATRLSNFLLQTIEQELPNLRAITEERSQEPRGEGKWSPRQELGHLIDSAANNHQRFVRASLDGEYTGPGYQADDWVRVHRYREMLWGTIVEFWVAYNQFLAQVLDAIPDERLTALCKIGTGDPIMLESVAESYVLHMQHHIDLLLRRPVITEY